MDAFLPKWLQLQEKVVARLPDEVQTSISNSGICCNAMFFCLFLIFCYFIMQKLCLKAEILFRSLPALLPTRPISARSNNARPVHQKDSADLFLQIFPVC